jgi:hypothetical protein
MTWVTRILAAGILSISGTCAVAAAASMSAVKIIGVAQTIPYPSQEHGYVYVHVDYHFSLPGVCKYSGDVDAPDRWMLRINSDDNAYHGLLALAITAYTTDKTVRIDYDDGFGTGSECRVTAIFLQN